MSFFSKGLGGVPPWTNPADYMLDLLDESTHYEGMGSSPAEEKGLMTGQEGDAPQRPSIPNFMESEHCQAPTPDPSNPFPQTHMHLYSLSACPPHVPHSAPSMAPEP